MDKLKRRLERLEKQAQNKANIQVLIAEKQADGTYAATIHGGGGLSQKSFPSDTAFENFLHNNKIEVVITDDITYHLGPCETEQKALGSMNTEDLQVLAYGKADSKEWRRANKTLTDKIKEVAKNGNSEQKRSS